MNENLICWRNALLSSGPLVQSRDMYLDTQCNRLDLSLIYSSSTFTKNHKM
jgi:hypothetical protein